MHNLGFYEPIQVGSGFVKDCQGNEVANATWRGLELEMTQTEALNKHVERGTPSVALETMGPENLWFRCCPYTTMTGQWRLTELHLKVP